MPRSFSRYFIDSEVLVNKFNNMIMVLLFAMVTSIILGKLFDTRYNG